MQENVYVFIIEENKTKYEPTYFIKEWNNCTVEVH